MENEMKRNPAREALNRAVNNAIADGAPVYVNQPAPCFVCAGTCLGHFIGTAVMEATKRDKLLARINRKDWWHVPPADLKAYQRRGKFLASTFAEAEFWGRPLDTPIHVSVKNPLIGDEPTIETELLGAPVPYPGDDHPKLLEWRWNLDAKLKKAALAKGYDALLLLSTSAYTKFAAEGKIPISLELNLLREHCELSGTRER